MRLLSLIYSKWSFNFISKLFSRLVLVMSLVVFLPHKALATDLYLPSSLDWFNVSRDITKEDLKGKVVILDFWTYGCVNCVHVLPDLHQLEKDFGNKLAVISVHSPKFENEKNPITLKNIIARYEIQHAVANDIDFKVWREFGVRAWPTFVVIGPDGKYAGKLSGEGHYKALKRATELLLAQYDGKVNETELPIKLETMPDSYLKAPGKIAVNDKYVAISDSLHHRIVLTDHAGKVLFEIGNGEPKWVDGNFNSASLYQPQGLVFINDNTLLVADTGNHAIRRINLTNKTVTTIAGTGQLGRDYKIYDDPLKTSLRSPWALAHRNQDLYIAMAGTHQIWHMDLQTQKLSVFAGSGREQLTDGTLRQSAFNQPSGLYIQGEKLYVADSEASAIRVIDIDVGLSNKKVDTVVGKGLFEFGDKDGNFRKALLQHTLGVVAVDDETLIIADTYNHKLKRVHLKRRFVDTIDITEDKLNEPGGIAIWQGNVFIADTNNQSIKVYDLKANKLSEFEITPPVR